MINNGDVIIVIVAISQDIIIFSIVLLSLSFLVLMTLATKLYFIGLRYNSAMFSIDIRNQKLLVRSL